MLDSESSLRLNLLRFPLIVGVVFIHAYASTVAMADGAIGVIQNTPVVDFVRYFISQGIAKISVPLFFIMSSYLFFYGIKLSRQQYFVKLRTRIRTLLIPFLFWNIANLLIIALAQAMPPTQVYFSGKNTLIANFSIFDYFNAIIGINQVPIANQFWFIRDLMILVLLAPIINVLLRGAQLPFIVIVFICWLFSIWPIYGPSAETTLFFCIGAYFAIMDKSLFAYDKHGIIFVLLYLPVVVVDALFTNEPLVLYLHKIGVVLGVFAALYLTKYIAKSAIMKAYLLYLSSASFFVYAAHEPLLIILRKIVYKLIIPESSSLVLALYFLIPTVVILLLAVVYRVLSRVAPRFTKVITGGR